ncbi:hypothetical protein F4804DRAFT_352221 [Jackrogersella minutella]|nr:hypothetical protein F4804DRAFT_352221 [Jackrogersella minutella]
MASLLSYRDNEVQSSDPSPQPVAGTVFGVILSFSASSILSWFLTQRSFTVKTWRQLPFITWLVFAIYGDSWIFVFATGIINYGVGVDSNLGVCSAAILLCLFCYVSTKFIIRGGTKRRLESKLYLFNSFGILTIYSIVCILNFVYRIARMEDGQCIIGIRREALITLITFDILINVYLTFIFLNPLRSIYSFAGLSRAPANPPRLRTVAIRTFIGALCTTTSSVVNLAVLMVLDGEPGWVCLTCCNADILFSALVIQWITSHDTGSATSPSSSFSSPDKHCSYHPPTPAGPPPHRSRTQKAAISLPLQATSTSQYEHIFGDLEPETDAASASGTVIVDASKNKIETCEFDDDEDPAPADLCKRGTRSTMRSKSGKGGESWLSTLSRARTRGGKGAADLVPQPLSPIKEPAAGVSAAVAADLERIRRYRERHGAGKQPPSSSSPPTPRARSVRLPRSRSASQYHISELVFEGDDDLPWHDLVVMEDGDSEAQLAGWI